VSAQPAAGAAVTAKADEIGGVVTGAKGPRAGVWVIAETKDLPTKYVRIVVTDDQGRFLIPACPKRITTCGCVLWPRRLTRTKTALGKVVALKSVAARTM